MALRKAAVLFPAPTIDTVGRRAYPWADAMYAWAQDYVNRFNSLLVEGRRAIVPDLWNDGTTYLSPATDGYYIRDYDSAGSLFSELRQDRLSLGGVSSSYPMILRDGTTSTLLKVMLADGSANATLSVPSGPTGSEQFGKGAIAGTSAVNNAHNTVIGSGANANVAGGAGGDNVIIGYNAYAHATTVAIGSGVNAAADDAVVIGYSASAANSGVVAIGRGTSAGETSHVVIGSLATTSAHANEVAIGASAACTNANATAVGTLATAASQGTAIGSSAKADTASCIVGYNTSGTGRSSVAVVGAACTLSDHYIAAVGYNTTCKRGVIIGYQASNNGGSYSIAIGYQATTTAANQMVVGSSNGPVTTIVLGGNGETNGTPSATTWRMTNATGSNIAGADLTIVGGRSTGSGVGGAINLQTSPAGSSGSSLNSGATRIAISGAGAITLTPATGASVGLAGSRTVTLSGGSGLMSLTSGQQWDFSIGTTPIFAVKNAATVPQIGFFNVGPAGQAAAYTQTYSTADRTLGSYTADDESAAYSGIDNLQAGSVYAQLDDLNALRTAYENLRAFVEDAVQMMNALVDDHQSYGLVQ